MLWQNNTHEQPRSKSDWVHSEMGDAAAISNSSFPCAKLDHEPHSTECSDMDLRKWEDRGKPLVEGSLETKIPTIWTNEKQSRGEAGPGRNSDVEKVRREKMRDGRKSEERRCRCAKGQESRETLCFSDVVWLRRV